MNIERAIARNRHHMSKAQIGWVDRYDEIVHLVGFRMVTPSEFSFAEEVGRWQRDHGLNPDGIIGPTTWERMQPLLGQGLGGGQRLLQPPPGPQTFAGARPGEISVDRSLLGQNREIENGLFLASRNYLQNGDLRWFFALAHATITQQINDNIGRFQRPNALIRLNLHFAQAFLRAVNSLEGEEWKQAFRVCQALQRGSEETMALVGETEICAGAMADVHIFIDLKRAIREVGCIPPEDYGNVLIFVNRGALAALTALRGQFIGAAEAMLQHLVAPLLDMEVKVWRNSVYTEVCEQPVPDPQSGFMTAQ